jgi:hypothetical protein
MNSLLAHLGRQPNVKLPSWEEAPTDQESVEVVALMVEITTLKENGLTTQALVIDFVYHKAFESLSLPFFQ